MGGEFDFLPRFAKGRVSPRALAWAARIGFAAIALILGARWLIRWLPRYLPRDWVKAHELDAIVDWKAARLFHDGMSPFSPEGLAAINVPAFGHPPTTPFWFLPLVTFEKALAAEIIGLSVWFCLAIHVYVCARAVRFPAPVSLSLLVWSGFIATYGFHMHFWVVQISEHIAFAYVLAWWCLRRGYDARAGVLIGIAGTLKLFPGLMFVFFLLARRWRAFIAASLTFLAVASVMTYVYGVASWKLFFTQQGPVAEQWLGNERNAGLQGILARLFSPICEGTAVATRASTLVAALIALTLLAGAAFLCWERLKDAKNVGPEAIDLPFALFAILSVFLNPWIWEHYSVLLIQPSFVVAAALTFAFRRTFRAWLDERVSSWALGRESLCLLFGVGGLVTVGFCLSRNSFEKTVLLEFWRSTKNPWFHGRFHLLEAVNYLPWVVLVALCYLCFVPRPPRLSGTAEAGAAGSVSEGATT